MKTLKFCYHGDGNPVCPPSKVLCRKCLDGISDTLAGMIKKMEPKITEYVEEPKRRPYEKRRE